jgi:uncharacterized membrane protein
LAWGALALLQIAWHAWWQPATPVGATLLIALVPLALPLLYWRRPARALLLAGMICLFYFCHGVAEAYSAPPRVRVFAAIEIILSVLVILASARLPKRRRNAGSNLPP